MLTGPDVLMVMKAMKVCQVIPRLHRRASGPAYAVPVLCRSLADQKVQTTLISLSVGQNKTYPSFQSHYFAVAPGLEKLGVSTSMNRWFRVNAGNFSVIHSHGLWMMPNVYGGRHAKESGVPYIVSPLGMLGSTALNYSRIKKAVHWRIWQRQVLQNASGFHATSAQELEDIRNAGFKQPVAVIPNGIEIRQGESSPEKKTLLFLGRLHPMKGLELALESWARIECHLPNWSFVVAGPGEDRYVAGLKVLARKHRAERVVFIGPVYGEKREKLLRSSAVLIMPSLAESFGMVTAEALSRGVPVIATDGTPWSGIIENNCGWWVPRTERGLTNAIMEACLATTDQRKILGENGRKWMEASFSWQNIASQMIYYYRWIEEQGNPPDFVDLGG